MPSKDNIIPASPSAEDYKGDYNTDDTSGRHAPRDLSWTESSDPISLFEDWLAAAVKAEVNDPHAMALATVDESGLPDVRMVLLKGIDVRGFVFYTNSQSAKGEQLLGQGKAALCFHWKSLRRQVRVRGAVEKVSAAEADAYFSSRARGSQIGAWASQQSRQVADRAVLMEKTKAVEARFEGQDVPRPPHWYGWRVKPDSIEFWQDGAFRLHDRIVFTLIQDGWKTSHGWQTSRLFP